VRQPSSQHLFFGKKRAAAGAFGDVAQRVMIDAFILAVANASHKSLFPHPEAPSMLIRLQTARRISPSVNKISRDGLCTGLLASTSLAVTRIASQLRSSPLVVAASFPARKLFS